MASQCVLFEEHLSCPVCLNIFEDPVVLSCSHSFCNTCLQNVWSRNPMHECPLCKRRSSKSSPLSIMVLKNLCEAFLQQKAQREEICSLHSERHQFFCLDHQQPVCVNCLYSELHTNHRFRSIDKAAQCHKAEVQKSLEPLKEKLKVLQKANRDWVQTAEHLKIQAPETERQIKKEFEKLHKVLKEEEKNMISSLRQDVDIKTQMINEKIDDLTRKIEDVSDSIRALGEQLEAPDVSFLQNYKSTMETVQKPLPQEPQCASGVLTDITKQLENMKTSTIGKIQQIFSRIVWSFPSMSPMEDPTVDPSVDTSVDPTVHPSKDPTVDPSVDTNVDPTVHPSKDPTVDPSVDTNVDPTVHTSKDVETFSALRKYACELTLDPNTVNYRLSLSEDNSMVTYGDHKQSYPDHPDRFTSYTQVLCREGLTRRCYWEVDWRGEVYIGVTYTGINRGERGVKCLGRTKTSWALLCKDNGYTAWHDNIPTSIPVSSVCKRVGVYVDCFAGSLSFYTVSSDTLTHLHTFYCTFTEPLIPGFWVWKPESSASLCQIE